MHRRQLLAFQETVEVRECLLQPLPQIPELRHALLAVRQKLVDPFADQRAADAIGATAGDLVCVLVR
jgi:hypothetical protein